MSLSSWLVAGIVPGVERQPVKKLAVDECALLKLLHRWREEAEKAGRRIERIVVAFEAGRDGFWLARWLKARSVDAYVIHAASVAVSREHRRAKTDRLDSELLKRAFLGWLRGERDHCKMVAIPTAKNEDAERPNRERERLSESKSDHQSNEGGVDPARHPRLQSQAEKGRRAPRYLRTPQGEPIPPNTLAELHRDMERRRRYPASPHSVARIHNVRACRLALELAEVTSRRCEMSRWVHYRASRCRDSAVLSRGRPLRAAQAKTDSPALLFRGFLNPIVGRSKSQFAATPASRLRKS